MKKLLIYTILASTIIIIHIILVCAQSNYLEAVKQASKTGEGDESIEQIMLNYGFKIDAYDINKPTMYAKIQAILN